ncbi:MAG: accessory factor UbiK family protein [Hyphomicrobiales bacterium]|jgi:BMFP domain-containing protein YqiC|nr:accessory factor UbiK family protein [Alphaproteobacteria bacterium]|tara:strand:+ start:1426 stop:1692 length:267 start_codon:yes stop_codon:yes gene_type:complete
MKDNSSKIFNKLAEVMSETAGLANGVKKEVEIIAKSQVERILNDFEVVQRDEFDVMKEMLVNSSDTINKLEKKIKSLENQIKKLKTTK